MANKLDCLAVIPARGGSKGIPGKNLRPVAGAPLVAHAIRAARGAKRVTRVVVSTDDSAIAAAARAEGAEVVRRPAAISGDTASSESALLHALEHLAAREGYRPDLLVFLQCTSPLTLPEDVDAAVAALRRQRADSAFTASPFHGFVWRTVPDGGAVGVNHDKTNRPRRQDREPEYLENGAVYVMKTGPFLAVQHRFFGKTVIVPMPPERALDIDEPADLARADEILRAREMASPLAPRLAGRRVKALVMDFDGVLTDNAVRVDAAGRESVVCSRSDGMGLRLLKAFPVKIAVISTERNPVVSARCAKLQIECIQGVDRKVAEFKRWCARNQIRPAQALFIGNDVNDWECLRTAGIAAAPADAHPDILAMDVVRLRHAGGRGAVREACDALIAQWTGNLHQGASHG